MNLPDHISDIKAIVLDVDGVLTDGRIGYGAGSPDEIKFFDVRDGQGIRLAMRAGLRVGILSGRRSMANQTRAKELGLSFLYEGCLDKLSGWETLLAEQGLKASACTSVTTSWTCPPCAARVFPWRSQTPSRNSIPWRSSAPDTPADAALSAKPLKSF